MVVLAILLLCLPCLVWLIAEESHFGTSHLQAGLFPRPFSSGKTRASLPQFLLGLMDGCGCHCMKPADHPG